jgi:hypothetical protein
MRPPHPACGATDRIDDRNELNQREGGSRDRGRGPLDTK